MLHNTLVNVAVIQALGCGANLFTSTVHVTSVRGVVEYNNVVKVCIRSINKYLLYNIADPNAINT